MRTKEEYEEKIELLIKELETNKIFELVRLICLEFMCICITSFNIIYSYTYISQDIILMITMFILFIIILIIPIVGIYYILDSTIIKKIVKLQSEYYYLFKVAYK